jgi:hypothetical protein
MDRRDVLVSLEKRARELYMQYIFGCVQSSGDFGEGHAQGEYIIGCIEDEFSAVAAQERERCAKECDTVGFYAIRYERDTALIDECARRIRAMGDSDEEDNT